MWSRIFPNSSWILLKKARNFVFIHIYFRFILIQECYLFIYLSSAVIFRFVSFYIIVGTWQHFSLWLEKNLLKVAFVETTARVLPDLTCRKLIKDRLPKPSSEKHRKFIWNLKRTGEAEGLNGWRLEHRGVWRAKEGGRRRLNWKMRGVEGVERKEHEEVWRVLGKGSWKPGIWNQSGVNMFQDMYTSRLDYERWDERLE